MAIIKVIEIMADSEKGWSDAAANAVKTASRTIKKIRTVWVKDQSATVKGGKIVNYRVTVKLTFELEA
ncbi:MAG: dodecin family protein [Hyphomicrobiaceae bacterium]|nr:dodecin family protein [Hyphomicrobiaceae bacterium]